MSGDVTRREAFQSTLLPAQVALAQTSKPPNIVFLISDDHSADDLGCYGNPAIRTPNLDRLASEGMRFTNAFVTSPQCSPSRSSMFTGCTPHTTCTSRLHTPLPEWEPSFLEPLKSRGYYTGAYRKVHQGAGFDKRWHFSRGTGVPFEEFFDSAPPDRPFFLHAGFTDPHRPYRPGAFSPPHDPAAVRVPAFLPDFPEVRRDLAFYYDAIARMDAECGAIFEILRRRNLEENTLVVFTADNGMPFARAKGSCYDSGLRVPLIARWPGRIKPGASSAELISLLDLAPTWLELAGLEKGVKMQGASFLRLLLGQPYTPRQEIFAERNWHVYFDPVRAVRTRQYKLIFNANPQMPYRPGHDKDTGVSWQYYIRLAEQGKLSPVHMKLLDPSRPMFELYDVEKDPNEFHNLETDPKHAGALENLKRRLSNWMHETYDFLPPPYRAYPAGTDRSPAYL
jgi:arylsulfatase A-like enzyme